MPQRLNFTKPALLALDAPATGRIVVHDAKTPTLGLRITKSGTKSFVVYRWAKGGPKRITLGRFPSMTIEQARREAAKINGAFAEGRDPAVERRRERTAATLGQLFDLYVTSYLEPGGKVTRTWCSLFRTHLEPWRNRRLPKVTPTQVRDLHARIGRSGRRVAANRVATLVRMLFNWARAEGLFEGENPAAGVRRFPEQARERFLKPEEMRRFLEALRQDADEIFRDFVLILLLTGARKSNVLAMRFADMDLALGTWTIPRTKTGLPHTVPLVAPAVELLAARRERLDSPWVFPGRGRQGHLVEPKRAWARLLERAEITDLHLHDLRRTVGSWQAARGASLPIIGATLGHRSHVSTTIYAHLDLDPVRSALEEATQAMLAMSLPTDPPHSG